MFAFASVQGYAFMLASTEVATPEGQFDVQKLVSDLTKEFASMSDEAKLASLQDAVSQIDGALDQGAVNENELLNARQTLVAMQEGVGSEAVGSDDVGSDDVGNENVEDQIGQPIIGESIVVEGTLPMDSGFSTGGFGGGGMAGGGASGAGGASGIGGGGFGLMAAGGLAAAAVASSDDDTPGNIATVVTQ